MVSSFFNAIDEDRAYSAEDFAAFFTPIFSDGVVAGTDMTSLAVMFKQNMQVYLYPGDCYIHGYHGIAKGDDYLAIDIGDGTYPRKDLVVARLDFTTRDIYPTIIKGVPASSPVLPSLVRTSEKYDIGLAEIYVAANAIRISQSAITDLRPFSEYCGFITALFKELDDDVFFAQILDAFENILANVLGGNEHFTIKLEDESAREELRHIKNRLSMTGI